MEKETRRERRNTSSLMLNLGARGERVFNATPRPLCHREINPVPTVRGRWVCPRASLEGYGEYKSLLCTGVRTRNRPASNVSLY